MVCLALATLPGSPWEVMKFTPPMTTKMTATIPTTAMTELRITWMMVTIEFSLPLQPAARLTSSLALELQMFEPVEPDELAPLVPDVATAETGMVRRLEKAKVKAIIFSSVFFIDFLSILLFHLSS